MARCDVKDHSVRELADDVAIEVRRILEGFCIDHVEHVEDALKITFSWKLPLYVEVTVYLHDDDTAESVKEDIRCQLQTRLGLPKRLS